MDFPTIEITLRKVSGNNLGFPTIEITSKKVRGNHVQFSISEIISKKYMKITWKIIEIWSSNVKLTSLQRGVPVGLNII